MVDEQKGCDIGASVLFNFSRQNSLIETKPFPSAATWHWSEVI
jgi:hypothetical protein